MEALEGASVKINFAFLLLELIDLKVRFRKGAWPASLLISELEGLICFDGIFDELDLLALILPLIVTFPEEPLKLLNYRFDSVQRVSSSGGVFSFLENLQTNGIFEDQRMWDVDGSTDDVY